MSVFNVVLSLGFWPLHDGPIGHLDLGPATICGTPIRTQRRQTKDRTAAKQPIGLPVLCTTTEPCRTNTVYFRLESALK